MNAAFPRVSRNFLILLAGYAWTAVGLMMVYRAYAWLAVTPANGVYIHAGAGVVLGLLVHHFGFLRIVNRNLQRIFRLGQSAPVHSFIPLRSYLTILIMVTAGILLRHSAIPRPYLAVLYLGIGSALILSSVRYLRVCANQFRKTRLSRNKKDPSP